ncbi:synaptotagmin-like protein 2 isoform X2 [Cyprinodon tularosa]|uniref:synaptotagmin-like protein 2 isoform X2 n=1 Tax=Cyprinodon tularosa TaxID=77115 RepID=UPI0018E20D44|nr:synaptotagmin-like protein 2 isoform X2 [Cyprinodon tularosa]
MDLTLSENKRSIEKSDEVKRSPLKTLHPRVLPKETPKEPNPESNPFRTFPIDLNVKPQTTAELESKPSAGMRPRTGSSQTIMPSKLNPSEDITPPPLTLEVIDGETCHGQAKQPSISTSTFSSESNKTPETMTPFTQLARAFIPQDNQHYLGPQEKAHIPSFQAVEHAGEETDAADKMIKAPSASSGNQSDQNSPSYAENIERSAWTKLSSRNLTSSRSLENLTSETTLALSSFSTMKSSVSSLSLQPQKMSSSRSSIYPLDTEVQGSIQFAVNYIQKLEEFQVFVVNCRGLAIAETKKNLSDPYVKCYLAPDKTRLGKKKTTVKKRTLNPTYNEVLKFKIPLEELKKQTLIVSVWHNDLFGRNSFLGDVDLNLSEWDFKNAEINEYKLKAKVSTEVIRGSHFGLQQNGGKMRVALRFIPKKIKSKGISTTEAGELLIWVKDCKDLPQVRRVIINPFVKCTVLPDTSRKSQQKTRVVKRTANPLFNHTMVYDGFQSEDLRQACVEITVWDRDRLHNHFIGGVRLGPGTGKSYGVDVAWMDSTTTEVNLWNKMLHSNGEWVEDVLPLRMLVMAKGL